MKYIMIKVSMGNYEFLEPVIFSNRLVHSDVAEAMNETIRREVASVWHTKTVSAGFINLIPQLETYGYSESLKLSARPEDAVILSSYDYNHGILS